MKIYQIIVTSDEIVDHDCHGSTVWEPVSEIRATYSSFEKAEAYIAAMPPRTKRNAVIREVEVL